VPYRQQRNNQQQGVQRMNNLQRLKWAEAVIKADSEGDAIGTAAKIVLAERDRLRTLAGELAWALDSASKTAHYRGIDQFCHNDFNHCINSGCIKWNELLNRARKEGVIE
jgi:hypothetical protein